MKSVEKRNRLPLFRKTNSRRTRMAVFGQHFSVLPLPRSLCSFVGLRIHVAACPRDGENRGERRGRRERAAFFFSFFAGEAYRAGVKSSEVDEERKVRGKASFSLSIFRLSVSSPKKNARADEDDGRPRGQQHQRCSVFVPRGSNPGSRDGFATSGSRRRRRRRRRQRHALENRRRRRHLHRPRLAAHPPRRRVQQPGAI